MHHCLGAWGLLIRPLFSNAIQMQPSSRRYFNFEFQKTKQDYNQFLIEVKPTTTETKDRKVVRNPGNFTLIT
jgi:hypothetical protein